jgi:outer membrane protein assembly factor BamB
MILSSALVSTLSLVTILSTTSSFAADWPQWRGPERTGYAPNGAPLPSSLPAGPKVLWRIKVGEGYASPVVAGGKLFYLDNQQLKEVLHALDAASGKELWRETLDDSHSDTQGPPGPRCTPVADGDRIYAQSCKGELQCRSVASGKLLWRVNYVKDFGSDYIGEKGQAQGAVRHGYNASPLIDGDHLIALAGSTNGASVVCFDKKSGKVLWKSQNDEAAYAPPIIATLAGRRQIVVFMCESLMGLSPSDGKLLWRVPAKTKFSRHVTTPVVVGDSVMVSSHEFGLIGVKVSNSGSGQSAEQIWVSKDAAINFSSPVVVGEHLYAVGPQKNLICVEAKTGKIAWSQDGYFSSERGKAHATFLVLGPNILAMLDSGQLVLFPANPAAFKEISRAQICGSTWASPAYVDGKLFQRDGVKGTGELLCVDLLAN